MAGTDAAAPPRPPWALRAFDGTAGILAPLGIGVHTAGLAWSLFGIPYRGIAVAAVVFVIATGAAFLVVRAIRRRPRANRVWRVLVAAHVAFWTVYGWTSTTLRPAGPVETATVTAWDGPPQPFLAGVGEASFRLFSDDSGYILGGGDTIAGYGSPPRRMAIPWPALGPLERLSQDSMSAPMFRRGRLGSDDLGARALVLRPRGSGAPLAIVRLDLLFCEARIHAEVARRVADLGIAPESLLLCATHTHSGPCGFACSRLAALLGTDHFDRRVFDRVVSAVAAAVRDAHGAAVPARIGFVTARDVGADGKPLLASNRRYNPEHPDRADTEVLGIRLDAADGDRRIALLLNYAVHPVWGRPEDFTFSKDLAGALERRAEIADGAGVLFVNGAEGDIRPKPKAPRPDRGDTLKPFVDAVAPGLRPRATQDRLRVVAASVRRDLGSAWYPHVILGSRRTLIGPAESPWSSGLSDAAASALLVPGNVLLWSAGLSDVRLAGTFRGGFGAVAALDPYLDHGTFAFGAVRLETPEGSAAICWTPAELLTSVGEQVKASARARGASPAYVFGLVNDYVAYAGTTEEYANGGYEGRSTLFGPLTSVRIREALDAALDAVGFRAVR